MSDKKGHEPPNRRQTPSSPNNLQEADALMEIELLISDHGDLFSDNLAVSDESSKPDKDTSGKDKHTREQGHKWKCNETIPLEEQLEQSEQAIKSLTLTMMNHTLSTSNLAGFLQFNIPWPLKAIWKKLEFYSQKSNFQSLRKRT